MMNIDRTLNLISRLKFPVFLLVWLPLAVYSTGQAAIDSLTVALKSEQNPLERLHKMLVLAEKERNCQTAVSYAEKAINLADSLRLEADKAKALNLSGVAWKNWGDNLKSIERLYAALGIYQQLNDRHASGYVLMNIGETYRASAEHKQSLDYLNRALDIFETYKDPEGLAKTYNRLAATSYEIFYNLPDFKRLQDQFRPSGIDFSQKVVENVTLKRELDKLLNFINQSDSYANQCKLVQLGISNDILSTSVYAATGQLEKALASYSKIMQDIEKSGDSREMPLALINLSGIYRDSKEIDKSTTCAQQALDIALKDNIKIYVLMSYYKLYEISLDLKDYKKAHEMLLFIHQTGEQYQLDDFALQMNAVKQQNMVKTRELEIKHNRSQLFFLSIAFIIILLSFSIFIVTLFRKNKRLKTLIEEINQKSLIISKQNEELSIANIEKDKFFSIIAHDIRGPFNGFLGLTHLMTEELPTMTFEQIQNIALSMKRSAANLYRLLENLLQWAKMQQGLIPYNPEPVSLGYLISECVKVFLESAKIKGVEIACEIANDMVVSADVNILQTIIRNLVSNALKFTHSGGKIIIAVRKTGDNRAEVSISDTGIGMSQDMVYALFRLDVRTSRQGTEGEPSTGLGLIICKDFIEKQGGKLLVESMEGKGSKFTFSLDLVNEVPLVNRPVIQSGIDYAQPVSDDIEHLPEGLRLKILNDLHITVPNILIVDDVAANLQILGDILEGDGYKVRPVLSGMQALQVAERERPDLILLDIMMADMDGFEVCRLLKDNQRLNSVPIIFISALNDVNDIVKALNAGGADYITKPFQAEEVRARVALHLKLYRQSKELRELNRTLDNRVEARTRQLEVTNKELEFHLKEIEQFTYITSHDLQEPLLTLTNFTQLIQEEYAGKLDKDGNQYIEFIYNAANRMKGLVKGLLDYSFLGKESVRSIVDLNKVVHDAIVNLDDLIIPSKAIVRTEELPQCNAHEPELKLLFHNLISNAIKFGKPDVIPEIEISAENQGEEWIFSVADNGIGIDAKHQEKIFVIFKRLHNRDEYGGSGIGLAHCKKIVEMHGGRIWVEANSHGGSTFKFTIPFGVSII